MEQRGMKRSGKFSSYERLVVLGLAAVAVVSPLYIDRRPVIDPELDDQPINISSYVPLLLFVLIIAIALSRYLDQSYTRIDPYWIQRVGGSSSGIVVLLLVLALVLKFKASFSNWDG